MSRMAIHSMPIQACVFCYAKKMKISARYIIYFFSLGMTNVPSFKVQTI